MEQTWRRPKQRSRGHPRQLFGTASPRGRCMTPRGTQGQPGHSTDFPRYPWRQNGRCALRRRRSHSTDRLASVAYETFLVVSLGVLDWPNGPGRPFRRGYPPLQNLGGHEVVVALHPQLLRALSMSRHMFVDENKSSGVLLAAAHYASHEVAETGDELRRLLLGGQERLHFTKERPARKEQILKVMLGTGARGVIIQSALDARPNMQRQHCLSQLLVAAAALGITRLQIERDDGALDFDRRSVVKAVRSGRFSADFTYAWLRPNQEPLLWVADAFAWSWAQGGTWRRSIQDVVDFIDLNEPQ